MLTMLSRKVINPTSSSWRVIVRSVSDKSKDGAVKEEGGTFSKKGEADENAFFHKLGREQLKKIKDEEAKDDKEKKEKK